jgi:hypothetical protein
LLHLAHALTMRRLVRRAACHALSMHHGRVVPRRKVRLTCRFLLKRFKKRFARAECLAAWAVCIAAAALMMLLLWLACLLLPLLLQLLAHGNSGVLCRGGVIRGSRDTSNHGAACGQVLHVACLGRIQAVKALGTTATTVIACTGRGVKVASLLLLLLLLLLLPLLPLLLGFVLGELEKVVSLANRLHVCMPVQALLRHVRRAELVGRWLHRYATLLLQLLFLLGLLLLLLLNVLLLRTLMQRGVLLLRSTVHRAHVLVLVLLLQMLTLMLMLILVALRCRLRLLLLLLPSYGAAAAAVAVVRIVRRCALLRMSLMLLLLLLHAR